MIRGLLLSRGAAGLATRAAYLHLMSDALVGLGVAVAVHALEERFSIQHVTLQLEGDDATDCAQLVEGAV
jgi:Co/Zn/Cd efflux system component